MACTYLYNGKEYTESELRGLFTRLSPKTTSYDKLIESKAQTLGRRQKELNTLRSEASKESDVTKKKNLQVQAKQKEESIKRLEAQIKNLEDNASIDYITGQMFDEDVLRLQEYIKHIRANTRSFSEIKEAENIVKFYKAVGDINSSTHPIFTTEALKKLNDDSKDKLVNVAAQISKYQLDLEELLKERLLNHINSNTDIQQKLGKKFTYDELVKAIPDIDKFTRDFLNISKTGIVSGEQSILAELMFYHMAKTNEEATSEIREKTKKLEDITQEVIKELNNLGYSGSKTFDIFFEKVDGKETGNLVSQISNSFKDAEHSATKRFKREIWGLLGKYYSTADKNLRKQILKDITVAQNEVDKWYRENTVIFDIRRLGDLWDRMSDDTKDFFSEHKLEASEEHKQEIIALVGQEQYDKYIDAQLESLENYIAAQTVAFENIENNPNITNLEVVKQYYNYRNNPFHGIKVLIDNEPIIYNNEPVNGVQGQNYILSVPKNQDNFYDENYKKVQSNPRLKAFYNEVSTLLEKLYAVLPPDQKQKVGVTTLPLFKQSFSELLLDKNLSAMTTDMWDSIINVITDKENKSTSVDMIDPVTGKRDIRYNYSGLGLEERKQLVNKREKLLYADFVATNEREPDMEEFKALQKQAQHDVSEKSSHDLGKILKLFTAYVVMAEHKENVLPTLTVLQHEFEKIKAAETTNIFGLKKMNQFGEEMSPGERENAKKQMAHQLDFFMNKAVNLVELPLSQKKVYSASEKQSIKEIDSIIEKSNVPDKYKSMSTDELTREIVELEILRDEMKDGAKTKKMNQLIGQLKNINALLEVKEQYGSFTTGSGIANAGLQYIQLKGLGWNIPAQMGNLLAGLWSNLITASDGRYFTMDDYMYGLKQMFFSSLKFLTNNKVDIGTANKTRTLMDRLDILQVPTTELFKASVGNISGKFQQLSPFFWVQKTEYYNQSPLVIAKLRQTFINDKDGNKSSVWNAIDSDGNLLSEFKTDENLQWETGVGKQVTAFKLEMEDIIRQTHGDYHNLSRMRAKKHLLGRAVTQFHTWMPEAINNRFSNERTSLLTGVTTKGRYRSYTPGGAALFGASIGTFIMPGVGTLVGGAIGKYLAKGETDMTFGQDLVFNAKQLARKLLFQNTQFGDKFTEVDAANLRQNIMELQILLTLFTMYILTKVVLFDDEDEKDSVRRLAHNIIANNLLRHGSDLQLFSNPFEVAKFTKNAIPLIGLLDNTADLFDATGKLVLGKDEYETGSLKGQSRFANKASKFVPTIFSLNLVPDYQKDRVFDEPATLKDLLEGE